MPTHYESDMARFLYDDEKAHYRRVATDVDRATPSLLAPANSDTGKLGCPQSFTVEISGYYS